jgi:hypothetical protein
VVEDLRIVVAHHREERALRAGRNAVVLVDDLHAHPEPFAPGNPDVFDSLRVHEIGRERIAEQVRDRHLRMAVLHRAPDFTNRIPADHAHEDRTRGFAATGPADEETFPPRRKRQQRQEHVARITLCRR